jgi:hypothetical protein
MSKRRYLPVLLIAIFVFAGCNFPTKVTPTAAPTGADTAQSPTPPSTITPDGTAQSTAGPVSDAPEMTEFTIQDEGNDPKYIVDIVAPRIVESDPRAASFNAQVDQMINDLVENFHQDITSFEYSEELQQFTNGLNVEYALTHVDAQIVSVLLDVSIYYAGAAHPLPLSMVINFDLPEERNLALADLFQPGADYLTVLSDYSTNRLREQELLMFEEGALPEEPNYQNWNIRPDGLQITFDPYQVMPYAAGKQTVLVPFSELSGILRPGGPVSHLIE